MKEGHHNTSGNDITPSSGLRYVDEVAGHGEVAIARKTATVHFTGWLENRRSLVGSVDGDQSFSFHPGVGQVSNGCDDEVEGVKVGDKRTLTIPAHLGYGARGADGLIAPHAGLIFHIELSGL